MNQGEIVIYQADDNANFQLDVRVENEIVFAFSKIEIDPQLIINDLHQKLNP